MERILERRRVLFVDTDPLLPRAAESACALIAEVTSCDSFLTARMRLLVDPPDFLVANVRLGAYNGLHLVYLALANGITRSIVYSAHGDATLIAEAQKIGAFYELSDRLVLALPSYVRAALPDRDRRSSTTRDRRRAFRGGRRMADGIVQA